MNIQLTELRALSLRLFQYLEDTDQVGFEVEDDYYWEISAVDRYDPKRDPTVLTLGQLSHDWERLRAILANEDPPVGSALVWLSAVLRNIAERQLL